MEIDIGFTEVPSRVTPSVAEVIAKHSMAFVKNGKEREAPTIPMCGLLHMEIVRSLQKSSEAIEKLKESFCVQGYNNWIGARFCVQPANEDGVPILLTDEIRNSWDEIWKEENAAFEQECLANPDFSILANKIFAIFDGNHRLYSWMQVTAENSTIRKYHPRVACTIFKGEKSSIIEIETTMHTVNKLGQAVVEASWVLQADRVRKILDRDLEFYKPIIEPAYFLRYKETMAKTKKGSWYTKKMPLDALIYILCENNIKSGEEALHLQSAQAGDAWDGEMKKMKHREMLAQAMKEWKVDAGKIASLLNPAYRAFMEKAADMYALTEKLKKDKVKDTVLCNPDRARLFTGVTYLDPELRIVLLEGHCNPDLCKLYYHPSSCEDNALKQWMHTWHIWHLVEGMAVALLNSIFTKTEHSLPQDRLDHASAKTHESVLEDIIMDFRCYADRVKEKFFNIIWFDEYGSKENLTDTNQCRAKRFVYRFFLQKERDDPSFFWVYPAAFQKWAAVDRNVDESLTFPHYSMYPSKSDFPSQIMSSWGQVHCPWYLEVSWWALPFDEVEKKAFGQLSRGLVPEIHFNSMKQGVSTLADNSAKSLEIVVETQLVTLDRTIKKLCAPKGVTRGLLKAFLWLFCDC